MILKKDTEYAICLLVYYAKKRKAADDFVYRREILHETGLSAEPYMRICRFLADGGLLETKPCGRGLGYRLVVPPEEITLKRVVELMQRNTELISLGDKGERIDNYAAWQRLQAKFDKCLESVTIGQLAGK